MLPRQKCLGYFFQKGIANYVTSCNRIQLEGW